MSDTDTNADRGLSEVARQTDHNPQVEEEKKDRRLENFDAVFLLFAVALLPPFISMGLTQTG